MCVFACVSLCARVREHARGRRGQINCKSFSGINRGRACASTPDDVSASPSRRAREPPGQGRTSAFRVPSESLPRPFHVPSESSHLPSQSLSRPRTTKRPNKGAAGPFPTTRRVCTCLGHALQQHPEAGPACPAPSPLPRQPAPRPPLEVALLLPAVSSRRRRRRRLVLIRPSFPARMSAGCDGSGVVVVVVVVVVALPSGRRGGRRGGVDVGPEPLRLLPRRRRRMRRRRRRGRRPVPEKDLGRPAGCFMVGGRSLKVEVCRAG